MQCHVREISNIWRSIIIEESSGDDYRPAYNPEECTKLPNLWPHAYPASIESIAGTKLPKLRRISSLDFTDLIKVLSVYRRRTCCTVAQLRYVQYPWEE